jgi:hypothetical protein
MSDENSPVFLDRLDIYQVKSFIKYYFDDESFICSCFLVTLKILETVFCTFETFPLFKQTIL